MIFKNLFGRKTSEDDWDDWDEEESSAPVEMDKADHEAIQAMTVRARAYIDYNERKIATIISKLNDLDRDIFLLLPYLVHLNMPGMPGHISDEELAPAGIAGFQVDPAGLKRVQNYFSDVPSVQFIPPPGPGKPRIYSLAAMGSLATIGQTAKSDFDIWVCVRKKEFTEEQLEALAGKLEAIEVWAEKKNHFESHFFITDIEEAKRNHFGASDSESAGSALGKLLKEEFFRTHTVLAGYPPLWTLMPPNISDEDYERLRGLTKHNLQVDAEKYIDLGNATRVTMEEAFGAALWQLNKAIGSPFKSAMKMALIEDYMDPESDPVLLCDRLKMTLTELASATVMPGANAGAADALGPEGLLDSHERRLELDGYLLMFNRILDYYSRKERRDLQDILRKCFYLKVGETITGVHDPQRGRNPKKDMLGTLLEGWGWENEQILDLNEFKNWPFDKNVALGKQVNSFIIDSYKRLSQQGATAKIQINPTDLTVLGRKLFTVYSRQENKIDYLPKIFEDSLRQGTLTFFYISAGRTRAGTWKVYRGSVSAVAQKDGKTEDQLLRSTTNLASLAMWLVMNALWDKDTQINLQSTDAPLTAADLQDLLGTMLQALPPVDVAHLNNKALIAEAEVQKVFAIINLGSPKFVEKVQRLDVLYRNSWGEVYYTRPPSRPVDQNTALRFCLDLIPRKVADPKQVFRLLIPSGRAGLTNRQLYLDFAQVMEEMIDFFFVYEPEDTALRTFAFQGEAGVSSFWWDGENLDGAQYQSYEEFFQKREHGLYGMNEMRVSSSPTKLLLPQTIAAEFQAGVVQVFFHNDGIKTRIYISDEVGGTIFMSLHPKVWPVYATRLALFLENIAPRLGREPIPAANGGQPPMIAFYNVITSGAHHDQFEPLDVTHKLVGTKKAVPEIHLVSETRGPDGKAALTIRTRDRAFTSAEFGGDLFRTVAAHVLDSRQKRTKAVMFVADLELPAAFRAKNCPKGAKAYHYLAYKRMIEGRLNQALQTL